MSMKLGKHTGSVMNMCMSGTNQTDSPQIGMGCTVLMWTDRQAATIIDMTPCTVLVQYDKVTPLHKGMTDSQNWHCERDPNGTKRVFRLTKNGWVNRKEGGTLMIGHRNHYHDYSF